MKKAKKLVALLLAFLMAFTCGVCAFAAETTEEESNNTPETANEFKVEDFVSGRLSSEDDKDCFAFTAENAGMATVTFEHDTVATHMSYFNVKVLDKNDNIENEFAVYADEASTVSAAFSVSAGKHVIVVSAGQVTNTTITYKVSVKIDTEARAEKEPNDSAALATELELSYSGAPKKYLGNIASGDKDVYSVKIDKPGFIYLYIYNTNGVAGDYTATLSQKTEGTGGTVVESEIASISIDKNEESVMSSPVGVDKGVYYYTVTGSIGGYEVRVYFSESTVEYESEYNNNKDNADTFTIGKEIVGSTYDAADEDWFKFTLTEANRQVYLEVKAGSDVQGTAKWNIVLYDANGNQKSDATATNTTGAKIRLAELDPGTYFVKIKCDSAYENAGRYYISTSEAEVIKPEPSNVIEAFKEFFAEIKAIDWSGFWGNFTGWFGKIDFISIVKSMYNSIKSIIGAVRGN